MAQDGVIPTKPVTGPVKNPKYENPLGFGILNVDPEKKTAYPQILPEDDSEVKKDTQEIDEGLEKKQN